MQDLYHEQYESLVESLLLDSLLFLKEVGRRSRQFPERAALGGRAGRNAAEEAYGNQMLREDPLQRLHPPHGGGADSSGGGAL